MSDKEIIFKPSSEICASYIRLHIEETETNKEDNIVKRIIFLGSCPGNSLALSKVLEDNSVKDIIRKVEGVRCGAKSTSCPDQLAQALKEYISSNKN